MVTKIAKPRKQANILSRDVIARTGVILYTILSSNGITKYFITVKNGVVDAGTHQDCPGYARCGHCYHVDEINLIEQSTSIGAVMADADTAMRKSEHAALDAAYASRGAEIEAAKTERIRYGMESDGAWGMTPYWYIRTGEEKGERHYFTTAQGERVKVFGSYCGDWLYLCETQGQEAAERWYAGVCAKSETAPAGVEKFFAENCQPVYGTCGHISKNPDDECPACRSKWYC